MRVGECTCTSKTRHASARPSLSPLLQVVHDFNNSAIALRRYFGAEFVIRQVLDLQLVYEAVCGRVGADAASVMRAFGQDASYSDAASRCNLLPLSFFVRWNCQYFYLYSCRFSLLLLLPLPKNRRRLPGWCFLQNYWAVDCTSPRLRNITPPVHPHAAVCISFIVVSQAWRLY